MAIMHERIKELRNTKGLTLLQVAEFLNVTEATAQRYETGKGIKTVPYEIIEKYAELFNCNPAYILGWDKKDKEKVEKKADTITDVTLRMKNDPEFLSLVETLNTLNEEQIKSVKQMLAAFLK